MKITTEPTLITRKEAAAMLAISVSELDRWAKAGSVKPIKLAARCVRYKYSEIKNFTEQG